MLKVVSSFLDSWGEEVVPWGEMGHYASGCSAKQRLQTSALKSQSKVSVGQVAWGNLSGLHGFLVTALACEALLAWCTLVVCLYPGGFLLFHGCQFCCIAQNPTCLHWGSKWASAALCSGGLGWLKTKSNNTRSNFVSMLSMARSPVWGAVSTPESVHGLCYCHQLSVSFIIRQAYRF